MGFVHKLSDPESHFGHPNALTTELSASSFTVVSSILSHPFVLLMTLLYVNI